MPSLFEKVKSEMRPGSTFISNSFTVPDTPADDTITVDDNSQTHLFVWRL